MPFTSLSNNQGLQNFVDEASNVLTAVNGAPSAGQFRTFGIVNRASIPDPSKDLRARMGIDRIYTQQAYVLQNEAGPNGEAVWAVANDDRNLIRFVGNWGNFGNNIGYGPHVTNQAAGVSGDYIEIVFYGTGLNLLSLGHGASYTLLPTIDGGSEGSNIIGTSDSNLLGNRNYCSYTVRNVCANLTFGLHTVKLRTNALSGFIMGFEILNESSNVRVSAGSAFVQGAKIPLANPDSSAYNSGFTNTYGSAGTRGGHVLVYLASDGTVKKDIQYTDAAAGTDHTSEEVARIYHPREFGASRADDFSTIQLTSTSYERAFTADDGSTTLQGVGLQMNALAGVLDAIELGAGGSFMVFTFVGTGVDLIWTAASSGTNGSASAFTYQIDGGSAVNFTTVGVQYKRTTTICASGLPYGTHTLRINRNTVSSWDLCAINFVVYQPKKPALPTGAIELADYNIMANFVANTSASINTVSTGVLKKVSIRELIYIGSWSISTPTATFNGGQQIVSSANNDEVQYTFFGTGFDYRFCFESGQPTMTVQLQSLSTGGSMQNLTSTNFPTASFTTYGVTSQYNSSTAILTTANGSRIEGSGFTCSGLPLGLYKLRVVSNSAAAHRFNGIDIIAPIHSVKHNGPTILQNTLQIGSQGIGESNRKTNVLPLNTSRSAQALYVAGDSLVSGTYFTPLRDASVTIQTFGKPIKVDFSASVAANGTNKDAQFAVFIDGIQYQQQITTNYSTASSNVAVGFSRVIPIPAGVHKIDIFWKGTAASTFIAIAASTSLSVVEVG